MAAIEAIHEITRWRSSAYSTVIILPRPNTEEHNNTCNSRSPLLTDCNNGPQLDAKLTTVDVGQYFMTKDTEQLSQFTESAACREYTLPRDEDSSDPKGWIRGNPKWN